MRWEEVPLEGAEGAEVDHDAFATDKDSTDEPLSFQGKLKKVRVSPSPPRPSVIGRLRRRKAARLSYARVCVEQSLGRPYFGPTKLSPLPHSVDHFFVVHI